MRFLSRHHSTNSWPLPPRRSLHLESILLGPRLSFALCRVWPWTSQQLPVPSVSPRRNHANTSQVQASCLPLYARILQAYVLRISQSKVSYTAWALRGAGGACSHVATLVWYGRTLAP